MTTTSLTEMFLPIVASSHPCQRQVHSRLDRRPLDCHARRIRHLVGVDVYILELGYWEEGMPFKMFQKYLKKKGLPGLGEPIENPVVEKRVKKDIPILGEEGLHILERVGTYMTMVVDCPECKKCIRVCPNDAISIDDEGRVMISTDLCEGVHCQKCVRACPPDKFSWNNLKVFKPVQQA